MQCGLPRAGGQRAKNICKMEPNKDQTRRRTPRPHSAGGGAKMLKRSVFSFTTHWLQRVSHLSRLTRPFATHCPMTIHCTRGLFPTNSQRHSSSRSLQIFLTLFDGCQPLAGNNPLARRMPPTPISPQSPANPISHRTTADRIREEKDLNSDHDFMQAARGWIFLGIYIPDKCNKNSIRICHSSHCDIRDLLKSCEQAMKLADKAVSSRHVQPTRNYASLCWNGNKGHV